VDPKFITSVEEQLAAINGSMARYETIKQFKILPAEFTVESGELTPTMKMKRNVVLKRYKEVIQGMYPEEDRDAV